MGKPKFCVDCKHFYKKYLPPFNHKCLRQPHDLGYDLVMGHKGTVTKVARIERMDFGRIDDTHCGPEGSGLHERFQHVG